VKRIFQIDQINFILPEYVQIRFWQPQEPAVRKFKSVGVTISESKYFFCSEQEGGGHIALFSALCGK